MIKHSSAISSLLRKLLTVLATDFKHEYVLIQLGATFALLPVFAKDMSSYILELLKVIYKEAVILINSK